MIKSEQLPSRGCRDLAGGLKKAAYAGLPSVRAAPRLDARHEAVDPVVHEEIVAE